VLLVSQTRRGWRPCAKKPVRDRTARAAPGGVFLFRFDATSRVNSRAWVLPELMTRPCTINVSFMRLRPRETSLVEVNGIWRIVGGRAPPVRCARASGESCPPRQREECFLMDPAFRSLRRWTVVLTGALFVEGAALAQPAAPPPPAQPPPVSPAPPAAL